MSLKEITKEELSKLEKVFSYRSRTIGLIFVLNEDELKEKWEDAQFELASKYQYQGNNEHIWDYYLAICCDFDEYTLGSEVRFEIENDRFCCRKTFLFNQRKSSFSIQEAIELIFPTIKSLEKITLLKPDELISKMKTEILKDKGFYTRSWEEYEIEHLANSLILETPTDG